MAKIASFFVLYPVYLNEYDQCNPVLVLAPRWVPGVHVPGYLSYQNSQEPQVYVPGSYPSMSETTRFWFDTFVGTGEYIVPGYLSEYDRNKTRQAGLVWYPSVYPRVCKHPAYHTLEAGKVKTDATRPCGTPRCVTKRNRFYPHLIHPSTTEMQFHHTTVIGCLFLTHYILLALNSVPEVLATMPGIPVRMGISVMFVFATKGLIETPFGSFAFTYKNKLAAPGTYM